MDLARDMIRLSGLEPDRDIAIEIIGTRPARSCTRSSSTPTSARSRPPRQKILRAARPPLDPGLGGGGLRQDRDARAGGRRGRSGGGGGRARRRSPAAVDDPPRIRRSRDGLLDSAARLHGPVRVLPPGPGREVRRLRRHRRVLRPGHALVAVLRASARGQAPARVGGPCAGARDRARAGRRRARPGGAAAPATPVPAPQPRVAIPEPVQAVATNGVAKLKPEEVAALAFARAAGVHEPHEPKAHPVAAVAAARPRGPATGAPSPRTSPRPRGAQRRRQRLAHRARAGDAPAARRADVPPPQPLPPRRTAPPARRAPAPPPGCGEGVRAWSRSSSSRSSA